ncbi:MAG TPA: DNA polymerase III subunit gamma/tau [Vulgatibacter sp.]|nr:DNA polymerase III subunit gamma/tau [Vulgatibacter sp.]
MSYLVLARKWRPQAFDDVTGQEHVVRTLANAIAQDRVAHAFLLCGPRGVGKTTTARLLARALNCESGPTATPCGTCAPCREIVAGSSVDVVEIDGASNNGVDSVRDLREAARYLPQRDRHKVFIIDEVHMLSVAAFNALLKTLEEPPAHVKFIFATTDPQKLPETILSRVQRHNFKRVPAAKMVERLRTICAEEGISISNRALGLLARQADGGMRDALSLLDQLLSSVGMEISDAAAEEALGLVDSTVVHALAGALLDRDGKRVVELLAGIFDRGFEPKRLCEELAHHLRDLVYVQAVGAPPEGRADVEAAALAEQASKADPAQLARLFDRVHGAVRELSFAAQPRLALEVALLTAVHMAPAQGIADLAARLEALASGRPAPGGGGSPAGGGARSRHGVPVARGGGGRGAAASGPAGQGAAPRSGAPVGTGGGWGAPGNEPPAAPAQTAEDLIDQVERLARARSAPRQAGGRADADRPAAGGDDGSDGHGEPPRAFLPDASPGGCATGACGDPVASDDPTRPIHARWRAALEEIRRRDAMLHSLLSEGRLAWLRDGQVALGFTPDKDFHRAQLAEGDPRRQAEELLSAWFGRATSLLVQAAMPDAPESVADEERREREARARRLQAEAREHPAVLAALSVMGGEIDEIQVFEER